MVTSSGPFRVNESLEAYPIVNFKARKISRGAGKMALTSMVIKTKQNKNK